ncbi:MAG: hypothetical protein AAGG75_05680 [Bacteroidota bacterium]
MLRFIPTLCLFLLGLLLLSSCEQQEANQQSATSSEPAAKPTFQKQQKAAPRQRNPATSIINRMNKHLELSEEQISSIEKLAAEYDFKGSSRKEIRAKRKAFRSQVLESVLTEEQRQQYEGRTRKQKE